MPRIRLIADNPWFQGTFAEIFLQHDTVCLPTADFSILPAFLQWAGLDLFTDMLATGALRFIKHFGSLAYVDDGTGITQYYPLKEPPPPGSDGYAPFEHLGAGDGALSASVVTSEEAISLYLRGVQTKSAGELQNHEVKHLTSLVLRQTVEVELRESFYEKVTALTARDIKALPG